MRFHNDEQRKAVFANMFRGKGKNTRVNSMSVVNTEVKSMKSSKVKLPKIKETRMRSQNVKLKDVKASREFCNMCKREKKLRKGRCRTCVVEVNRDKKSNRGKYEKIVRHIETNADPRRNVILRQVHDTLSVFAHINGSDFNRIWREYEEKVEKAKEEVRKGNLSKAKTHLAGASRLLWKNLEIQIQETRLEPDIFWEYDIWEEFE